MSTILVPGNIADELGAIALQQLANELNTHIQVYGRSQYHGAMTFAPKHQNGNGIALTQWLHGRAP